MHGWVKAVMPPAVCAATNYCLFMVVADYFSAEWEALLCYYSVRAVLASWAGYRAMLAGCDLLGSTTAGLVVPIVDVLVLDTVYLACTGLVNPAGTLFAFSLHGAVAALVGLFGGALARWITRERPA